ncbi:hypothetical protein AGLY_014255 [Aphis glycines]|uniref:Uncharacterized protein n=1 Tax=Aphis glycines TaxID=307491 RepID=A0A6G0T4K6_APHGL|nr:hypothetical protein AGLY_014255 [Aphis glycines]
MNSLKWSFLGIAFKYLYQIYCTLYDFIENILTVGIGFLECRSATTIRDHIVNTHLNQSTTDMSSSPSKKHKSSHHSRDRQSSSSSSSSKHHPSSSSSSSSSYKDRPSSSSWSSSYKDRPSSSSSSSYKDCQSSSSSSSSWSSYKDRQSSSSSSTYKDDITKKKSIMAGWEDKRKAQHDKPTQVVLPEKRDDVKPMFPKPSNRYYHYY